MIESLLVGHGSTGGAGAAALKAANGREPEPAPELIPTPFKERTAY